MVKLNLAVWVRLLLVNQKVLLYQFHFSLKISDFDYSMIQKKEAKTIPDKIKNTSTKSSEKEAREPIEKNGMIFDPETGEVIE